MNTWGERVLSASVGGLVTFAAMYMVIVGKYVSRADVSQMIATESPYVRDQRWITDKLNGIQETLGEMNQKLDNINQ